MTTPAELAALVHGQGTQAVLAITGGGSRAIAELLEVPGASRTLLEAIVSYSEASLVEWLGGRPEQFCSEATARAMAMAAFQRAITLGATADDPLCERLLGIGCTASLASDRPKRGAHRVHVGLQTAQRTATWSLELTGRGPSLRVGQLLDSESQATSARSRAEEEAIAANLILNSLADGVGVGARLELPLRDGERVIDRDTSVSESWSELLVGVTDLVEMGRGVLLRDRRAVFPGAFNPLHAGHRRMAELAARRLGCAVGFEISVVNVDKPPLDFRDISERCAQFDLANEPLWFTRAPTFVEKSRLFPRATFVVGLDTIERIAEACYYGGDEKRRDRAIEEIAGRGCRFLVFGRVRGEHFQSLSSLTLPAALAALCDEVPESEFRQDISSTQIRKQAGAGDHLSRGSDLEAKA